MPFKVTVINLVALSIFLVVFITVPKTILSQDVEITEKDAKNFKLTVVVLTMNRPQSLARLLKSLRATDFEFDDDKFDVEIHVDKSLGLHYDECVEFARNFSMPKSHRGKTSHRLETQNQGLRNQWFQACYPATDDGSYCLILEDDLELSPFWFTWLRKAWIKYGHREDIAGITLSRQYMMIKKPERTDLIIKNEHKPFLYKFVGTWGYAPHPKRWREMLDWFYSLENPDGFDPYVKGLATSDWLHMHTSMRKRHMTWEQWHIYHSEHHGLYTMYITLPRKRSLCSNWREAGLHMVRSFNRVDFPALEYCSIELQDFPDELRKFGWDALLEMEKTEDEDGNPLDRSQFNEQQFVEGGLEKEGFYGSYDQLRMLGSDVLAGGGYTPRGV